MGRDSVAIIGPQTSAMAPVLSHLSNELHVPILSFTALDPAMSPLQYRYFLQTAPNDKFLMNAVADMISYFGWREIIAIYTDEDQSRNGISVLGDKLADKRSKISYKAILPPDPTGTRNDVIIQLTKLKSMEARVIVLHTFAKTGLLVFNVAKELGMMGKDYVWIASSWLSTVLDSNSTLSLHISDSIQGVLTLRPHTPQTKKKGGL